jgi:hypothetical protein
MRAGEELRLPFFSPGLGSHPYVEVYSPFLFYPLIPWGQLIVANRTSRNPVGEPCVTECQITRGVEVGRPVSFTFTSMPGAEATGNREGYFIAFRLPASQNNEGGSKQLVRVTRGT